MKNTFKGFHSVEESVLQKLWKDDKTLFVFDANVLLNLYGYAIQTRGDFFKILQAVEDRLWIPYQAGLEYQRRRLSIIKNEKGVFNDIEDNLNKIQKIFKGDFEQLALKRRFPKLYENTEKLEKEINKNISNYKKSVAHWNSEQPCVRSHDSIRDEINELFSNKVGNKPEHQEWLDNLYKEGSERFSKKIPPGFKDSDKGKKKDDTHFVYDGLNYERQYGDLILWKQLIEKSQDESIENVIFITDDAKDDWWYKISSNGEKTIGPLAELQAEIYRESNINCFHMYSTSTFLEDGKSNLSVDVDDSSIIDAGTPHVLYEGETERVYLDALFAKHNVSKNSYLKVREKLDSSELENDTLRKIWSKALGSKTHTDKYQLNEDLINRIEKIKWAHKFDDDSNNEDELYNPFDADDYLKSIEKLTKFGVLSKKKNKPHGEGED